MWPGASVRSVSESGKPIRFGILGAANIAPLALVNPAKEHGEVEVLRDAQSLLYKWTHDCLPSGRFGL